MFTVAPTVGAVIQLQNVRTAGAGVNWAGA